MWNFTEDDFFIGLVSKALGISRKLVLTFRLAGILPFNILPDISTSGMRHKISPSGFPLSALCLVVSAGLYVGNRMLMLQYPTQNETAIKAILKDFQQLVMISTGMLAVASTSLKRKDWCTFFSNILRVGRALNFAVSHKGTIKRRLIFVAYTTFFSASLSAVIYMRVTRGLANGPLTAFASNSYIRFVTWTYLAHFTTAVITLEEHLRLFNEHVERLSLPTNAFGKLYYPGKQQKFIRWKVLQDEIQVEWSRTLASLHEDIYESFKALTAAFSFVAVPFVLMVFSDTVTLSFTFLVGVANQILPIDYLLVVSTFVFIGFSNLTVITVCCDNATTEFNATHRSVHKAYNNVKDVHVKKELLQFSKMLFTRKASFIAAGLFRINISLQYKILAAVSSYLVILTQFQMQEKHDV